MKKQTVSKYQLKRVCFKGVIIGKMGFISPNKEVKSASKDELKVNTKPYSQRFRLRTKFGKRK